ncbi:MAG: ATP-binding cassette domain-containing protein [Streptosporangiales bacterium]
MFRLLRTPLPWLAALLAAYLLVPILAYVVRLAGAPPAAFSSPGLASALIVSLATASISTAIIAVLGIPLAYLLARGRGRGSVLLGVVVQLPLALPPLISGILLIYLVGPYSFLGAVSGGRLTGTLAGIVLAQTFVAAPFLIVSARSAFAALDPALDDVAATLGHPPASRFTKVALPAAAPGIAAGLLLSWLRAFGEFGATVVLAYHPYSLPVYTYVQFGSTGLTSTLAPVGATLGAAFGVLALAHLGARLRHPRRQPVELPAVQRPVGPRSYRGPAFDLDARVGEFHLQLAHRSVTPRLALLGPSGAGKSITLRLLAGLLSGTARLHLGDDDLTGLRPELRDIGYVPQDAALFPHLPVWRQVTFGVGTDPAIAAYWLSKLGIDELAHRRPDELSGGQRRRVALARALARSPSLLLLDEPFTGLDAPVRDQLRRELRALQRDTGIATVLVTHDPAEAALLADEVLVIDDGRMLQAGRQETVYNNPAGPHVARLLGSPNLAEGRISSTGRLHAGDIELAIDEQDLPAGLTVQWSVPPDLVRIAADGAGAHPAVLTDRTCLGGHEEHLLALPGGIDLIARTRPRPDLVAGQTCHVDIPPEAINVWPADP